MSDELVVVGPHLDDAVLSCGGMMARAADEGRRVILATVYTGQPSEAEVPPHLRALCNYPIRREEDRRAAEVIGAEVRWFGLMERAFREPPITRANQVFHTPDGGPGALQGLAEIGSLIRDLLDELPGAQLLAPLGVGNNIDHVTVFAAAMATAVERDMSPSFKFYEDSYAIGTRMRHQHPVTRTRRWPPTQAPELVSPKAVAMLTVMSLFRRGPSIESFLPADSQLSLSCEPVCIAGVEERKLEAVWCYESQVRALGGRRMWEKLLPRYHRQFGMGEPLWSTS